MPAPGWEPAVLVAGLLDQTGSGGGLSGVLQSIVQVLNQILRALG